jgi:hypothetical protein
MTENEFPKGFILKPKFKEKTTRINFTAPVIAFLTIVGVMALFYAFVYTDCKAPKEITFFILGAASQWVNTILNFYFGSSQGSQAKDKMLANSQPIPVPDGRRLEPTA